MDIKKINIYFPLSMDNIFFFALYRTATKKIQRQSDTAKGGGIFLQ